MKVETLRMHDEFELLRFCISDDLFLTQMSSCLIPGDLVSKTGKIVAHWVLQYFERYKKAPGNDLNELFKQNTEGLSEQEQRDIAIFLKKVGESDNKITNYDFKVDYFVKYLKVLSLKRLRIELQLLESSGDWLKAESLITNYKRIEKPAGEGVSLYNGAKEILDAFMQDDEVLFELPGAVGKIVGKIHRGDFISCLAPMKRGKTFWLWYLADIAATKGLKVVFFTLEMTQKQMLRRAWQANVGRPLIDQDVTLPKFVSIGEGRYIVESTTKFRERVDMSRIPELQKIMRKQSRGGDVRIISLPAYSASVEDIRSHLQNLSYYEDFTPDMVVVDYADIVAPSRNFKGDYRNQLDDIWKKLRKLAQELNIAVVSASQSDRKTLKTDIEADNVAEDIRKLAHVTCMVALNQSKDESEKQIMRMSQIALREGKREFDQAVVLQCLDIGRFCLDSKMTSEVDGMTSEKKEKQNRRVR